jgi:adenosine deaminase
MFSRERFSTGLKDDQIRESIYLAYQAVYSHYPDHVFRHAWDAFCQQYREQSSQLLLPALKSLGDDFLYFLHHRLHVKLEKLGEWQDVLGRIDCIAIRAGAHVWGTSGGTYLRAMSLSKFPDAVTDSQFLARPWDPVVEDYVAREGLHETHLHLNGSTHVALCWQRALKNPDAELEDFSKKYNDHSTVGESVRELCHTIDPSLNPIVLRQSLLDARLLRAELISWERNPEREYASDIQSLRKNPSLLPTSMEAILNSAEEGARLEEWRWITRILKKLTERPCIAVERMLHLYLLHLNRYRQLLVQRTDMVGFDQFQKYTYTDLREPSEKFYLDRFRQMHGPLLHSRQHWVEGRLAPKSELVKNIDLLTRVLKGYVLYVDQLASPASAPKLYSSLTDILNRLDEDDLLALPCRPVKLAIVMHFVKSMHSTRDSYRHGSLRNRIEGQANVLRMTLETYPSLRKWIRGVDAAANELHASPEVFAPVFRYCRQFGLSHASYHAGEDFPHLISGVRQIIDALELLDLHSGDRIGHGTAIGIHPELWMERMPKDIAVKRGEWLIDLIRAWQRLRNLPQLSSLNARLEREIEDISSFIFEEYISPIRLERMMQNRGLMPRFVFQAFEKMPAWSWKTASYDDAWREEARLVANALDSNQDIPLLVKWWRDKQVIARSEEMIRVPSEVIPSDVLILLQQSVLAEVRDRNVVIETLPTSNVRIAQYQSFKEHHALRWMKVPGFEVMNDPNIMVSLGSDDPGIFVNDLGIDFYHLYAVTRSVGLTDVDALAHLAKMNERGRQYRFHSTQI